MLAQECLQLRGGGVALRTQHDGGCDLLAKAGMRKAESRRFRHCRMAEQHLIDLQGCNLLASPIDLFLDAAGEHEVAVGVETAEVASTEPTADERTGIRIRIGFISTHDC